MTGTVVISVLGILAVAVVVAWAWMRAVRARWLIDDLLELMQGAVAPQAFEESLAELLLRTRQYLTARGVRDLRGRERTMVIEVTKARAESARAEVASRIELMPQVGLLGTVVGLTLTMMAAPETVFDGLGLALVTTLVGLLAAAIAKARLEPEADAGLHLVLALAESEILQQRVADLPERAMSDAA